VTTSLGERLEQLRREVERDLATASSPDDVEELRVRVLGKKGALTREAKAIGALPPEERPAAGETVNTVKNAIETVIAEALRALQDHALGKRLAAEAIDVTLPGRRRGQGTRHPLSIVTAELLEIFRRLGFAVATGPEVETTWHNFEALNIPPGHPAREQMDTLYVDDDVVLRTHTSPVQIRVMESQPPPVRIVCPGRVFRADAPDASHSPYFHQIEGLWVDEGISLAHLKWALTEFVHQYFGAPVGVRFRPSYFPFTEPSAEIDMKLNDKWLEISGAGQVHPQVVRNFGLDPERHIGFAFGSGLERLTMLRHGIDDLRLFFDGDLRFLEQFS